jgi:hypothetical protein
MRRVGCACGANKSVGLLKNIVALGLLSRKEANHHKQRAEQQAHQYNFAVGALVSVMK